MRLLLVVPLIGSMACVTIDGQRKFQSQRTLELRCEPGNPVAILDPAVRDRVRLVFSKTEHCTQTYETTFVKEQRWRLADPVRTAFAVGAGLIVAVPLMAATIAASKPTVIVSNDLIDHQQPANSAVPGAITEPVIYGILIGSFGMGGAAYEAMKATDRRGSVNVVEQTARSQLREVVVKDGVVNAPGFQLAGYPLISGVLELSLDEAQSLADGELYLDGVRVDLSLEVSDRLSLLPVCKRALDGYEAGLPAWNVAQRAQLWKMAEACDRRGWTFAEDVRRNAIASRP